MDSDVELRILDLYRQGRWEEILDDYDRNRFLPWIWPDRQNLNFIGNTVRRQNSESLISIGCGSGLLEWLISMATGIRVIGIETDGNWWTSKHSPGTFIPIVYVDDSKMGAFPHVDTASSVLLFCYFNNLEAFLGYVNNFEGNCFIVIGPGEGRGTYTIPEPFRLPEGQEENWKLLDHEEIRSSKDYIAVYIRKTYRNQLIDQ